MSIKMRLNESRDSLCDNCKRGQNDVLNIFDVRIGNTTFVLCDSCIESLFNRCLHAITFVNGRIKSKKDLAIINGRRNDRMKQRNDKL